MPNMTRWPPGYTGTSTRSSLGCKYYQYYNFKYFNSWRLNPLQKYQRTVRPDRRTIYGIEQLKTHFRISTSLLVHLSYNSVLLLDILNAAPNAYSHYYKTATRGIQTKYKRPFVAKSEVTFTHPRLVLTIDLNIVI